MSDETMIEYPRFCTLIVGREAPEGPCAAPAIGVYRCISWNAYRLVGNPDHVGMEVATNQPVSLCRGHRRGHPDWPVILEFDDAPTIEEPATSCGHTALIGDVQHQCNVVGEHRTIELAAVGSAPGVPSPVHGDGEMEWSDDGELLGFYAHGISVMCGEAIVADDKPHSCLGHVDHDGDHADTEIAWNEDGDWWPARGVGEVKPAPVARGGGKPRRG